MDDFRGPQQHLVSRVTVRDETRFTGGPTIVLILFARFHVKYRMRANSFPNVNCLPAEAQNPDSLWRLVRGIAKTLAPLAPLKSLVILSDYWHAPFARTQKIIHGPLVVAPQLHAPLAAILEFIAHSWESSGRICRGGRSCLPTHR